MGEVLTHSPHHTNPRIRISVVRWLNTDTRVRMYEQDSFVCPSSVKTSFRMFISYKVRDNHSNLLMPNLFIKRKESFYNASQSKCPRRHKQFRCRFFCLQMRRLNRTKIHDQLRENNWKHTLPWNLIEPFVQVSSLKSFFPNRICTSFIYRPLVPFRFIGSEGVPSKKQD